MLFPLCFLIFSNHARDPPGGFSSPSYSPASITDMRDGSRTEYGSPTERTPLAVSRSPSNRSEGSGSELVDMQAIDRIISERVATQLRTQMAPLKAQNDALQQKVELLEGGLAKIGDKVDQIVDPFSSQTFTNNMLDLLTRANAAGRAAAKETETAKDGGDLDPPQKR